ncbi:hypothetical protein EJB05_35340, partial [Eragrostis curvula]
MYAGGERRPNGGGGGDGGRDALLRRRKQPVPPPSSSAAASSSSSGRGEEGEEEGGGGGGGKRQGRRKKQGKRDAVARAIRDGLPAAAASCWRGGVSVVQESGGRRGRSRRWDSAADGSGHGGDAGEGGPGPGSGTAAAAAWCCVCPGGDCSLEPNPSANGKEDPGLRSLLEQNDFFSADCNPHADGLPAAGAAASFSYCPARLKQS